MRQSSTNANLRRFRQQSGLSQRQLAQASRVHYVTIAKIETGVTQDAELRTLRRLAKALSVTVAELVGERRPKATKRQRRPAPPPPQSSPPPRAKDPAGPELVHPLAHETPAEPGQRRGQSAKRAKLARLAGRLPTRGAR